MHAVDPPTAVWEGDLTHLGINVGKEIVVENQTDQETLDSIDLMNGLVVDGRVPNQSRKRPILQTRTIYRVQMMTLWKLMLNQSLKLEKPVSRNLDD